MNVGLISTLVSKQDVIFADKLSHASLIDGAKLSEAKLIRFKHNDLNHLKQLLNTHRQQYKKALIISESIFSMDGDQPNIDALVQIKTQFEADLMIDEAHAIGCYGPMGIGCIPETHRQSVDYICGTFGKSGGSCGAFMGCSEIIKEKMIQSCRSFIYSTALPIPIIQANIESLKLMIEANTERQKLENITSYFRKKCQHMIPLLGDTHIIPVQIGDDRQCQNLVETCRKNGFWVHGIHHPTVPKKQARIRLSLRSPHTHEHCDALFNCLKQAY